MNNKDNIDWKELVAAFSSYEGSLKDFCTMNEISKSQLYYYRKKFEKQSYTNFHSISMKEEKVQTEINLISAKPKDVRIEIGAANIYIPANEIAILTSIIKELASNV
ncbi:MAG TPA: hypothetical protein DG753_05485 [Clostridium sp.]|nr:hypothetical protein [Clostridium sp.]